jgi:hypothetical protein
MDLEHPNIILSLLEHNQSTKKAEVGKFNGDYAYKKEFIIMAVLL